MLPTWSTEQTLPTAIQTLSHIKRRRLDHSIPSIHHVLIAYKHTNNIFQENTTNKEQEQEQEQQTIPASHPNQQQQTTNNKHGTDSKNRTIRREMNTTRQNQEGTKTWPDHLQETTWRAKITFSSRHSGPEHHTLRFIRTHTHDPPVGQMDTNDHNNNNNNTSRNDPNHNDHEKDSNQNNETNMIASDPLHELYAMDSLLHDDQIESTGGFSAHPNNQRTEPSTAKRATKDDHDNEAETQHTTKRQKTIPTTATEVTTGKERFPDEVVHLVGLPVHSETNDPIQDSQKPPWRQDNTIAPPMPMPTITPAAAGVAAATKQDATNADDKHKHNIDESVHSNIHPSVTIPPNFHFAPSQEELAACKNPKAQHALHNWYSKAKQLDAFRQQHGHTNVPQKYTQIPGLGAFVNKCRTNKKENTLGQRKIRVLESLGFDWGTQRGRTLWNERFANLLAFKRVHGHCEYETKHTRVCVQCRTHRTIVAFLLVWVGNKRYSSLSPSLYLSTGMCIYMCMCLCQCLSLCIVLIPMIVPFPCLHLRILLQCR